MQQCMLARVTLVLNNHGPPAAFPGRSSKPSSHTAQGFDNPHGLAQRQLSRHGAANWCRYDRLHHSRRVDPPDLRLRALYHALANAPPSLADSSQYRRRPIWNVRGKRKGPLQDTPDRERALYRHRVGAKAGRSCPEDICSGHRNAEGREWLRQWSFGSRKGRRAILKSGPAQCGDRRAGPNRSRKESASRGRPRAASIKVRPSHQAV
jgi:hypothetical protein